MRISGLFIVYVTKKYLDPTDSKFLFCDPTRMLPLEHGKSILIIFTFKLLNDTSGLSVVLKFVFTNGVASRRDVKAWCLKSNVFLMYLDKRT